MPEKLDVIWSNTDFPYMCLKDRPRTLAFKKVIDRNVKKGDVVLDVGSGSGILALFSAAAGAGKVYAVEIDHILAMSLQKTAKANGYGDIIKVVEADILETDKLPKNVDVVIAEIIETGLIDELQVPAMNRLRDIGVITKDTKIIPAKYETFVEPIYTDLNYYGYKILAPQHEWPFYKLNKTEWHPSEYVSLARPKSLGIIDFSKNVAVEEQLDSTLIFDCNNSKNSFNAIRLSGVITLDESSRLGPTNALNGDKIFPIEQIDNPGSVEINITYEMGGGMKSFDISAKKL